MTNRVSDTGPTTAIAYDAMNRPLNKNDSTTAAPTVITQTSVTYDGADNIASYTDNAGTTAYQYDAANNVVTVAEPGGSCPAGAVLPAPVNTTKCIGLIYDPANRLAHTDTPNGVDTTYLYDGSSRKIKITAIVGSTLLAERDYSYTTGSGTGAADSSLIQSTSDPVTGGTPGTISMYSYDQRRPASPRSRSAPTPPARSPPRKPPRTPWTPTATATSRSPPAPAPAASSTATTPPTSCAGPPPPTPATTTAPPPPAPPPTPTTPTATKPPPATPTATTTNSPPRPPSAPRPTPAPPTTNAPPAGAVTFTNSILGKISSTTGTGTTNEYIRTPNGTLLAMQVNTSGTIAEYYYTTDTIGSTILLTNSPTAPTQATAAATYTYDSDGKTTSYTGGTLATGTNPFRYAGGYTDPNGTIKLGARYYDPTTARFTQTDPSGQEANNYTYAGDNPISKMDPTGLYSDSVTVQACWILCVSYSRGRTDQTGDGSNSDADNSSGRQYNSIGLGLGTPGGSLTFGGSSGDEDEGLGTEANGSAFGFGGGLGSDGWEYEASGLGLGFGSTIVTGTWY